MTEHSPPDDLFGEIWCTLNHARIFIVSREKMHPDGVKLYDELRAKIEAIVAPNSPKPACPPETADEQYARMRVEEACAVASQTQGGTNG